MGYHTTYAEHSVGATGGQGPTGTRNQPRTLVPNVYRVVWLLSTYRDSASSQFLRQSGLLPSFAPSPYETETKPVMIYLPCVLSLQ